MAATQPSVVSLGGGLILNKDVFSMSPGEALQLRNFEPDIEGGYKKILGTTKFNTNICPQVSASTERVVFTAIFNDVVLAGRGGSIHRASAGSGSWTSTITSLGTPTQNYEHRLFNFDGTDKIVITTGTSNPQILNSSFSTSVVNASGTANFKFVEIFKNHIFFSGDSSNKQQVSFMGPNLTNDFTSGNGGGTIKVDTEIVGLRTFRNSLIIFGRDKIFKVTGTSSANFAVTPVTRNIGCIDSRSIQELGGDVVFLAPDGLRTIAGTERIDDTELGTVSKQVQKRINEITTHNINSLVIRSKSQYRLFFPTSADQDENSSRGLISVIKANPNTGALGFEYSDMQGLKVSSADSEFISGTETVVSGGYDGFVYKQESGNVFTQAESTVNISGVYRSPDMTMGDPGIRKSMQKVIWNIDPGGTLASSFLLEYDFSDDEVPQPEPYSLSITGNIAQYGLTESTYGSAVYGSTGSDLIRQPVEGSGFTIAAKILDATNNSPVALKGFEMEFTAGGRR
tara:strand:- start:126 stop:1664 length:1539 start_codon:yes stop_codon:yes gene_type:complete